MPEPDRIRSAADLLWQHWQCGQRMPALPPACRPATRAEGYAIQATLEQRSDKPLFGWKIAATSVAGQEHIQVDGPIAGRLLAERRHSVGAAISLAHNLMRMAECEFAFRMAHDLAPRATPYTRTDVLAATHSLHPAIEIPDTRFSEFEKAGAPQLIADNACTGEYIIGTAAGPQWRALDLVRHAVTACVGSGAVHTGSGANVLGDPLVALAWIANELSAIGVTLKAGQTVITGTCMAPIPVVAGDAVEVDFGVIGRVGVHFTE